MTTPDSGATADTDSTLDVATPMAEGATHTLMTRAQAREARALAEQDLAEQESSEAEPAAPETATQEPAVRAPSAKQRVPFTIPAAWAPRLEWMVPLALVAVAGATRFIGLGHPDQLVFDETYYVKDAFSLSQLGYEAKWGEDPNASFVAGQPSLLTEASYVVHPPLGKWIIAAGMAAFGSDNGWGWRSATALAGVITVLLTYFLAKRLTKSVAWAGIAGFLIAIDGVAIVMSRVALLDGILTMFLVLGVLFITLDRPHLKDLSDPRGSPLGRLMWNRPWIIAAGVAFGAASAVKWSGLYALAGYGIYLVVTDALARHRSGAAKWALGALAQGAISFIYLVPVAVATYLISWTGWFVTSGGYNRGHEGGALAALLDYHRQILDFHNGLTTGHSYMSPAWQWPLLLRPTSMYWNNVEGDNGLIEAITPIPNPLIWWVGIVAVFYMLYRFAYKPTWTIPIILTAVAVGYLPWLAFPNRTIFQFYTVVMVPFLVIAIVMAMRQLAGSAKDFAPSAHAWRTAIVIFLAIVTLVSIFFMPLWTGMEIPHWYWKLHMWIPSWI